MQDGDVAPVTLEEWRKQVDEELGGAPFDKALVATTREGLRIAPLYTERDWPGAGGAADRSGFPGRYPFTRGVARAGGPGGASSAPLGTWASARSWDLDALRAELDRDLAGGATGVAVAAGVPLRNTADLDRALGGAAARGAWLSLSAGGDALPLSALVLAWRPDAHRAGLLLGADPLGALARDGRLPASIDDALDEVGALASAATAFVGARAVTISTEPYVLAGADAATELACALSAGAAYVRAMVDRGGLSLAQAGGQVALEVMVGSDVFLEIAKLRAARLCFSKLFAAYEEGVVEPPLLLARTSPLWMSRRDPWVNILRATHATFAAALGGAEAVVTACFDEAVGAPDALARRLAIDTQHVLLEEAHIGRVVDPAGGSYYVEAITEKLARAAWDRFGELEREGGLAASIASGSLGARLAAAWSARAADIAKRREGIVGVTEYPNLTEEPLGRPAVPAPEQVEALASRDREPHRDWIVELAGSVPREAASLSRLIALARRGATLPELSSVLASSGEPARAVPLPRHRLAEAFEALRDQVEARFGAVRPRVFLANLGPAAEHAARAGWVTSLLAVAGIEAVMGSGTEPGDAKVAAERVASERAVSGALVACLCGSDERYLEQAEAALSALRESGARRVVCAGPPRDREATLREAGADGFVFLGCDVLTALRDIAAVLEPSR